ncbi:MAG: hypothetical protein CMP24_04280 [Rickettsiales bacterium]|nr:hypothetical protein [Rickettsiales bacterium]|tara:strand:- start:308 stop:739 length:432 start_codon:yes stop_codon:yes gene_type:complete
MILFDLCCENKHTFEAWFPSSKNYEEQLRKKMVKCPICDNSKIKKALMAPNLGQTKKKEDTFSSVVKDSKKYDLANKIKNIKKYIEKNTEDVGKNFAEEARKIYYGEKGSRPIRGQTTTEQAKELEEEGVPFSKLPWSSREDA